MANGKAREKQVFALFTNGDCKVVQFFAFVDDCREIWEKTKKPEVDGKQSSQGEPCGC